MSVLNRDPAPPAAAQRALGRITARGTLKALLATQLALAGLLVWTDIAGRAPLSGDDPIAPSLRDPVGPGDQTRPYSPRAVPRRPGADDPAPAMPAPGEGLSFAIIPGAIIPGAPTPGAPTPGAATLVQVTGAFRAGDDARFEAFLDALATPATGVSLHSPGGDVDAALAIGRAIRARGLATLVAAGRACVSACPLAFAGGVPRTASARAWIGVHQIRFESAGLMTPNQAAYEIQLVQGAVTAFWHDMGVDTAIQTLAMQTPPDQAYYLLPPELTALRLATAIID